MKRFCEVIFKAWIEKFPVVLTTISPDIFTTHSAALVVQYTPPAVFLAVTRVTATVVALCAPN